MKRIKKAQFSIVPSDSIKQLFIVRKNGREVKYLLADEYLNLFDVMDFAEEAFGTRNVAEVLSPSTLRLTAPAIIKTTTQLIRESRKSRRPK